MEFAFGPALCFGTIGACVLSILIGAVVDALPKRTKDAETEDIVKRAKEKMRQKFASKEYKKGKSKADKKRKRRDRSDKKKSTSLKTLEEENLDFESLDEGTGAEQDEETAETKE